MSDFKPSDISPPARDRDGARRRAQNHFAVQAERDALVKQELERERATSDAKTAKLKALRLAKEEAEREAEDLVAKDVVVKAPKKRVKKFNIS